MALSLTLPSSNLKLPNICLARHDAALKVLFCEQLYDEGLIDEVPPGNTSDKPKSIIQGMSRVIGMSLSTPINKMQ